MGDEAEQLVLSTVENGVGYLTINRPSAFNAMSLELAEQFLSAIDAMANDDSVRAVVVRGEGKIFSAGGDIKQMLSDVEAGDRAAYFREPLASFNRMALALRVLPKPVITAVHGAVAGAAFNFMLAGDIIIAREGTKFNQAFVSVGVSPDCGDLQAVGRGSLDRAPLQPGCGRGNYLPLHGTQEARAALA